MAHSSIDTNLTLTYTRRQWDPISKTDTKTIHIKPVTFTGPRFSSSSVQSPKDSQVITIGEDVKFEFEMTLPVTTNAGFAVVVSGVGVEGLTGQVRSIGRNIVPPSLPGTGNYIFI